jgi:hypothetical protein
LSHLKKIKTVWAWRFMPIILVTWKREIGRIVVPSQPGEKVSKTPSQSIRAGPSGIHLSFQVWGKCKLENCSPGLPEEKP